MFFYLDLISAFISPLLLRGMCEKWNEMASAAGAAFKADNPLHNIIDVLILSLSLFLSGFGKKKHIQLPVIFVIVFFNV